MKKNLAKESVIYIIGGILNKALAFFLIPIYTSYLTVSDYGIINVCNTIISVFSVITIFGLDGAMTRFYFEKNKDEQEKYISTIFSLSFIFSISIVAFTFILGYLFSYEIIKQIPFWPYLFFSIGSVFLSSFPALILAIIRARRSANQYVFIQLFQFVLNAAVIIVMVVILKQGAAGKIKADFISRGVVFGMLIIWFIKNIKFSLKRDYVTNILKYSSPLIPHALGWWGMSLADRLIMQYYLPLKDVGIFSLAYNFGVIVLIFGDSLNNAWAPFFFEKAGDEKNHLKLAKIMKVSIASFCFVAISIDIISPEVVKLITHNPGYILSIPYIPFLALSFSFISFYTIFCNQLFFIKKTYYLPIITGAVAILNIIVKIIVIPKFGIWGVVISTVGIYVIYFFITYVIANKQFKLPLEITRIFILITFVSAFTILFSIYSKYSFATIYNFPLYVLLIVMLTVITLTKEDISKLLGYAKYEVINKVFKSKK